MFGSGFAPEEPAIEPVTNWTRGVLDVNPESGHAEGDEIAEVYALVFFPPSSSRQRSIRVRSGVGMKWASSSVDRFVAKHGLEALQKFVSLLEGGASFAEAGRELGLTREAARQIASRLGTSVRVYKVHPDVLKIAKGKGAQLTLLPPHRVGFGVKPGAPPLSAGEIRALNLDED